MPFDNPSEGFRIQIVRREQAQLELQLDFVSYNSKFRALGVESPSLHLWLPELAPSVQLLDSFTSGSVDWSEYGRLHSLELRQLDEICEVLRLLACSSGLAILSEDRQHHAVAVAIKEHLLQLECERRWKDGLMVGGYVYPLREEIQLAGGLWFARHKVWTMPNRRAWQYIQSLMPGDF